MNLAHLHPNFHHLMNLTDKERIYFLHEPRWIGYTKANEIISMLSDYMSRPKRLRTMNLLFISESNNGKTTIIHKFKDLYGKPTVDEEMDPQKPVLLTDAPSSADEKGLYAAILDKFWAPYKLTSPVLKLRYQVIHLMKICNVKIIIIDEFHSLLAGSANKQREVMNGIKLLSNELKIPIVGVGTKEAIRVLHLDPQHASRFDVVRLSKWEKNKEFQNLLVSFEKVLPLKNASKLHLPKLASELYAKSDGNIGDLHQLLIEASTIAINDGSEIITNELIKNISWFRSTKGIREIEI